MWISDICSFWVNSMNGILVLNPLQFYYSKYNKNQRSEDTKSVDYLYPSSFRAANITVQLNEYLLHFSILPLTYMTIHRNVNLILWTNKVKHIWISCSETFLQISLHYCQKKSCSMRYEESHKFRYINVYELLPKRFLRISSLYLYWPDISALLQCKDCSYNFCNSAVQHLTL